MRSLRRHRVVSRGRAIVALASAALLAVALSAFPAQGSAPSPRSDDSAGTASQQGPMHVLPGHMIGPDYEPDKFYVRRGDGQWQLTYTPGWQGDGFSEQVRGTLPNLRAANAIFDDESGTILEYDEDFTAQQNTDDFIARLPKYRKHGLIATDVNLQGGNPGFEGAGNSAFNSDGSLRKAWFDRAAQVIEASDKQNMVVVLGYFYFRQDDVLEDDEAVRQAVTNTTDWLIENNYRNVIIEIANEHNDDDYHDIISSDEGMTELIQLAQSRFDNADFQLAVSASRWGDGSWEGGVADAADLALLHCNGLEPSDCASAAADHQEGYGYPAVVNETDNTAGEYSEDTLNEDKENIDLMVADGTSWGYMLNQWNQYAPCVFDEDCGSTSFDHGLGQDPGANGEGAKLLRNFAHGVFDHLQSVVFSQGTGHADGAAGPSAPERVVEVGDSDELESALSDAKAGDRIVLADGEYEIGSMENKDGTADQPITVVAKNKHQAVITEGQLEIENSSYVTFEGLKWTNSDTLKVTSSHHVRVTRNNFRMTESESLDWVLIYGANSHHNRVDHNLFAEKHQLGNFITIDGSATQQSQHDRIDHNYFRDIGPRHENEMETIRVGWSEISESSGHTIVEHNLFENCDGDPEIVSVKSNDNIVRYNTFRKSQGTLTQRHGNRGQLYGNFFLGEGKKGTGGIRVYGKDHTIYDNYFEGLTGTGYDAALQLDGGDVDNDGSLDSHFRVYRATVVHNTFVNNVSNIEIGANYEHPPADSVIADNLVTGSEGKLINELKEPENHTYAGNIAWPTGSATVGVDVPSDAVDVVDPLLVGDSSVYRLGKQSPAINSGTGDYEFVTDDMDGQARIRVPDVGADERSTADITRRPLTPADVGPNAP